MNAWMCLKHKKPGVTFSYSGWYQHPVGYLKALDATKQLVR